jgi:hypothetical protein
MLHSFFYEHGRLAQISIFQTYRKRRIPFSIFNIVKSFFLEKVQNREKEFFLTGIVQRCSLVDIDHIDVDLAFNEESL